MGMNVTGPKRGTMQEEVAAGCAGPDLLNAATGRGDGRYPPFIHANRSSVWKASLGVTASGSSSSAA